MHKRFLLIAVAGLLIFASAAALTGCGNEAADQPNQESVAPDTTQEQPPATEAQPEQGAGSIEPVPDATELKKEDVKEGTGKTVKENDSITVHYTLWLAKTGEKIESSKDSGQPATFPLAKGSLIDGWVEGIPGMKEGGVRRLIVPPAKGYGSNDMGTIPPNSTLVFEVELVSVN